MTFRHSVAVVLALVLVPAPVFAGWTGTASWYGHALARRRTANGERFDPHALTCAHRTLPFGTRLRLTNLEKGRSVLVRINDRGPWYLDRELDVSLAVARRLGMVTRGVVPLSITRL